MTSYRAYWTLAEAGRPVSMRHLHMAAASINAKVDEFARQYDLGSVDGCIRVASHLGHQSLRMDARSAYEARQNVARARRFIADAGYIAREDLTSLTRKALR